jgi:HAD superfamily hydrolase (TIGR01549 family)
MRYPIVFWDSGGTIFHSHDRPEGFADGPPPSEIHKNRSFRAERALEMFGHEPPANLPQLIDGLEIDLRARHGARYSLEVLAGGLYNHLGMARRREETLLLADAIGGPRYRAWLWDGVADALEALHRSGVRMGVIADTDLTGRMMRGALAGVGLVDFFGPIICSCDFGVQKPDGRIFATALAALAPSEPAPGPVLYVGDNPAKDVEGATAYGWDAALHPTKPTVSHDKAVVEFSDYQDLVRLVLEEG